MHSYTILSHRISHGHIFSVKKLKLTQCIGLYTIMNCKIIEGFHAKNAYYIAFWVDFHFLQGQASFWQADLFCHEKHRIVIVFVDLHFVLRKSVNYAKNSVFKAEPLGANPTKVSGLLLVASTGWGFLNGCFGF